MSDANPEPVPRTNRAVVGAATLFALILLALGGLKSYKDLAAAQAREESLEGRIEASRQQIETLTQRIERLKSDPVTLERLARRELGWVRPGEVVIVLPEPGAKADPPAPATTQESAPPTSP